MVHYLTSSNFRQLVLLQGNNGTGSIVLMLDVVEAATNTTNYGEKENEKNSTSLKTFRVFTVPIK